MKLINHGPNCNELTLPTISILFSYETPVCARFYGGIFLLAGPYSRSTKKHIKKYIENEKLFYVDSSFFEDLFDYYPDLPSPF